MKTILHIMSAFVLTGYFTGCSNEAPSIVTEPNSTQISAIEDPEEALTETLVEDLPEEQTPPDSNTLSLLWGVEGELWSPTSRLPYFGKVGYMSGAEDIPDYPVVANVRDYGAMGDGQTDDSDAILRAIEAVQAGAIYFPEGNYIITKKINITRPQIVLRGDGPDKSRLFFPKSLLQIEGEDSYVAHGVQKSKYSFGSAFVEFNGRDDGEVVTIVTEPAKRGDLELTLESTDRLQEGDLILLQMFNHDDLGLHLHAGCCQMGEDSQNRTYYVNWGVYIDSIDGNTITLDRPLRTDIEIAWRPRIRSFKPNLQYSGIEGLSFEFPGVPKRPHLMEEGFNAIQFRMLANCWVRNVRIVDADLGISLSHSRYCTIQDIRIDQRNRTGLSENGIDGITGHHALWASSYSHDNLFEDFEINTRYHHDISVEHFANGNVFRNGRAAMINLDHHGVAPYENLFSNLVTDDGGRLWDSSGRFDRMPHAAARPTFWNIRYESGTLQYRGSTDFPIPDWPQLNIVGLRGTPPNTGDSVNAWIEPLPDGVHPPELHDAQKFVGF